MTNTSTHDSALAVADTSSDAETPTNSSTDDEIRPTEEVISPSSFETRYKVHSLLDLWPWNMWSLVASAIAILLLLGLSMTAVFVSTDKVVEPSSPDSSSIPIEMVERYYAFRAAVSSYSKPISFDEYTSAQSRALDWMTWVDTTVSTEDLESLFQRYAVMVLFFACNGENWRGYEIPLDEEPDKMECNFLGFKCDATGLLTSINLADKGLVGTLPPEVGLLSGLTSLYLNLNDLEGPIPDVVMDKLTNLEYLNLEWNRLTSSISPHISRLSHLKNLTLAFNRLTGPLPSSMTNLTSLEVLNLDNTEISGPIFDFLPSWTNLTRFGVVQTDVTGEMPTTIGANTKLQELRFTDSLIYGSIFPTEIGLLTNLEQMYFSGSELEGTIPTEIGRLTNLVELLISDTNIEGSIPSTIGNMLALHSFALTFTPKLTGTIPAGLVTLPNLERLSLEATGLSGNLPPLETANNRLSKLNILRTDLEGTIPKVYCDAGIAIAYPCQMSCTCCEECETGYGG